MVMMVLFVIFAYQGSNTGTHSKHQILADTCVVLSGSHQALGSYLKYKMLRVESSRTKDRVHVCVVIT